MKKITEWLDMLKEPYRSEALALFKIQGNEDKEIHSGTSAILWAFTFTETEESTKWLNVAHNWSRYIETDLLGRDYNKIPRPIREEFERMALRVLNKQQSQVEAGTRQKLFLSARFIVWKIRMETTLIQEGHYKVNDHISPCLSRMFEKNYPEYNGVFEKRKSKYDIIISH